jgi:hypothetical protein
VRARFATSAAEKLTPGTRFRRTWSEYPVGAPVLGTDAVAKMRSFREVMCPLRDGLEPEPEAVTIPFASMLNCIGPDEPHGATPDGLVQERRVTSPVPSTDISKELHPAALFEVMKSRSQSPTRSAAWKPGVADTSADSTLSPEAFRAVTTK